MLNIPEKLGVDYLLVNSTNEYLSEYSDLSENARYTLTGFSGSTGDAILTREGKIYLFVDGRYHTQADMEAKEGVTVVKLAIGQKQDEEILNLLDSDKTLAIVAKKVSQSRYEYFAKRIKVKLLGDDLINNHTESYGSNNTKVHYAPKQYTPSGAAFISDLEEVSYLTGLRNFSKDYSSKIYAKLFINGDEKRLFYATGESAEFLKNYTGEIQVDKRTITAYDYHLIKNPIDRPSPVRELKSVKTDEEIELYKKAFEATDKALLSVRNYIESSENLSEYDISEKLREEFIRFGAKSLSFKSIVAINQNSALAHYSKNSPDIKLKDGSLVLIDCGAYYESGLATDITRVFVKGNPSELQKKVYTTVLKAFLNTYNSDYKTGYERDMLAHQLLDNKIDGFTFSHGLGHGIGINVHEAPPSLNGSDIAKEEFKDNMTFTIEPGLYNPEYFGVRLENSCYYKNNRANSLVRMPYESKLIDFSLLSKQEKAWLEEFEVL